VSTLGPIVDCNVHLWSQRHNPLFWLTDRTLVRDLIGNYDSLPDEYTLGDCEHETAGSTCAGSGGQTPASLTPSRRRSG
jgi:predicted TIM-barrel fold metal-dependent hydrolase